MTMIKANYDPTTGFFQSLVTGSTEPTYFFEITGATVFTSPVTFLSGAIGISGSGGGAVDAVFGRTGTVVAAANDYNATQISHSAFGQITGSNVALAIQGLRNFAASQTGSIATVFGRTGAVVAATNDYTATQVSFSPISLMTSSNVQSAVVEASNRAESKVPTVFGRSGAIVAVANDYNATQVSHSAFGTSITGSTVALALQQLSNRIVTATGSVASVFGRTGLVTATANDYNATQISHSAITSVTGSTVALAIEGLRNFVLAQTGSSSATPTLKAVSGFVASGGTPANRRCYTAANTVARGANSFSVSVLFNVKHPSAPEAQTIASCWDGTNGWYIEVEGRVIRVVLTTSGGTQTVEKQIEAPFYSKAVLITGTYSGDGTFAFQNLYINNYSYVNTFTGGTDGTFVPAAGSDVFTIGGRQAGTSHSAINCRVAGVAYYTTNLDEDGIANVFESSRDSGYLDTTGTPANLWTIISSYPTTTWTATSGADNLTAENAVALTQEDLSLYWF
mgnify:FL=1